MEKNNIEPTSRAVIEPLRACPLRCKFCYHLHSDMKSVKSFDKVKKEIDWAKERGNDYIDVTGGEPMIYPEIDQLVSYALSKDMHTCIITSCVCKLSTLDKVIEAGIDDFLISVHGLEETHDFLVNKEGARKQQIEFMKKIPFRFRFNFVINKYNQNEILEVAKWMSQWNPYIVNFINMNPHGQWASKKEETKNVIADLNIVQPLLEQSIEYLESKGIGVNIRYYPMCRIKEEYRRCICNDFHVCLSGDTKIKLVNGTNPTIKELAQKYKRNENFWIYSLDENNNIVNGVAHSPRITKRNVECIKLLLNNGKSIICTPDHLLMTKEGSYIKAKDSLNVLLFPFFTHKLKYKVVKIKEVGILEEVYDITVDKYHNFALDTGIFVHNCFDPYEWDYNIQPKTFEAHRQWGINCSNSIEWKQEPCKSCDLQNICGGINKAFNRVTDGKYIEKITDFQGDKNDFYYYRKNNILTLKKKTF